VPHWNELFDTNAKQSIVERFKYAQRKLIFLGNPGVCKTESIKLIKKNIMIYFTTSMLVVLIKARHTISKTGMIHMKLRKLFVIVLEKKNNNRCFVWISPLGLAFKKHMIFPLSTHAVKEDYPVTFRISSVKITLGMKNSIYKLFNSNYLISFKIYRKKTNT